MENETTPTPAPPGPTVCCSAAYSGAWGTHPFSIVQRTRNGRKFFEAEWLPTRCIGRFATKREATNFVKSHENRCYAGYGRKKG